jgi:integrase
MAPPRVSWHAFSHVNTQALAEIMPELSCSVGLEDARTQALAFKADVRHSNDPLQRLQDKRKAQREAAAAETVASAVARYFDAEPKREERYWKELRQRFDKLVIPKLDKPVVSVTRDDIKSILLGHKPGARRTLLVGLSSFFTWCASDAEIISESPVINLKRKVAAERDRILTDAEIVAFWKASEQDELFGPFYRLLLLTAQRREEVGGMRWPEIDGDVWKIPGARTKNDEAHIVHLSPMAVAQLPKQGKSEFVFTTTGETSISGYGRPKARLDELMQVDPWRVHDLRRTAASKMAEKLKIPPHVIDRVLNHASGTPKLRKIYQRYEYLEERKTALNAWGDYLHRLLSTTK